MSTRPLYESKGASRSTDWLPPSGAVALDGGSRIGRHMSWTNQIHETKVFLREWFDSPRLIGSITPSSSALATAMAASLRWRPGDFALELGAGSGAISTAVIKAGVPPASLIMIELSRNLCRYLRWRFPQARVINTDATQLTVALKHRGIAHVKFVVSSLPLFNMPIDVRRSIVKQASRMVPPGGHLVQYSDSPMPPFGCATRGAGYGFQPGDSESSARCGVATYTPAL